MNIRNSRFEIYEKGDHTLGLIVFNHRLARRVNKYLGFPYSLGTTFDNGEEPQFTVNKKDAPGLLITVLKLDKDYVNAKFTLEKKDEDTK